MVWRMKTKIGKNEMHLWEPEHPQYIDQVTGLKYSLKSIGASTIRGFDFLERSRELPEPRGNSRVVNRKLK